ncbi:MAG: ABC transporter permease, partial [Candidatus Nezhaarchaeota archaeon]|nr:ABC transporter permease [Candidatus Nezhaarchaeota archaeon]
VKRGAEEVKATLFAVDYGLLFEAVGSLKIREGGVPTEAIRAIVGRKVAFKDSGEQYFTLDDVVSVSIPRIEEGRIVGRRSVNFRVGAILEEYGGALIVDPDSSIFLSPEAGRRLLGMKEWSGVLILAHDASYVKDVTSALRRRYEDRVQVIAFSSIAETVSSITGAINFINFSTSLSAFAVAIAGVAATMITSVMERTREIGVMKAIGYTNVHVLLLILMEAVVMSLIGGSAGIALGAVGAHVLSSQGFAIRGLGLTLVVSPKITMDLIAQTLALTIAVGLVGGTLPAYKASKIPPAVALRYE